MFWKKERLSCQYFTATSVPLKSGTGLKKLWLDLNQLCPREVERARFLPILKDNEEGSKYSLLWFLPLSTLGVQSISLEKIWVRWTRLFCFLFLFPTFFFPNFFCSSISVRDLLMVIWARRFSQPFLLFSKSLAEYEFIPLLETLSLAFRLREVANYYFLYLYIGLRWECGV